MKQSLTRRTLLAIPFLGYLFGGPAYGQTKIPKVGDIVLGRIENEVRKQWISTGEWVVLHGDNGTLEIHYDKEMKKFYFVTGPTPEAAATTGYVPSIKTSWGGAANQAWIELE